jgi:O-antigen/teichoic acid export membrane protein
VTQLFFKIFIAQQRYSLYNRIYLLTSAAAFVPLLWMLSRGGITFHDVIWCNVFANGLGIVFSVIAHRSNLVRNGAAGGISRERIADFFSVGIKGYISSVAFLLLYRADFFIVGHLAPKALGAYTIAVFIGEAVQKIPDWLGLMLVPKVSVGQDDDGSLTRRYLLLSWGFVAAVAAVLGVAALAGFRYLELLLGSDYHDVEFYVLALMPKALIHCVIAICGARLAGHAYTLYHPLAGVVAFVVLMVVDVVLFQFLGIAAAIIGITTAYAVAGFILAAGARRQSRNRRYVSGYVQT